MLLPFYAGTDHEAQAATIERLHLAGSIIMGDNMPAGRRRTGGLRSHDGRHRRGWRGCPRRTAGRGPG